VYNDSHLLFVRADLLPPMLVKVSNLLAINDIFIRIVFILSVKLIRLSDNTVKVYDGQFFDRFVRKYFGERVAKIGIELINLSQK